jgi:hypothetical protein
LGKFFWWRLPEERRTGGGGAGLWLPASACSPPPWGVHRVTDGFSVVFAPQPNCMVAILKFLKNTNTRRKIKTTSQQLNHPLVARDENNLII